MSWLSAGLLSSELYFIKINLNPGFCPYIPALNLENIY